MKVKKFICGLLMLTLLAAQLPAALAAGAPEIAVGSNTVDISGGETTVQVPVTIANNPSVAGFQMYISKPDGWTITEIRLETPSDEDAENYTIFCDLKTMYGKQIPMRRDSVVSQCVPDTGAVIVTDTYDISADGYICWVTYSVPAGTANGDYKVTVTPKHINTANETGVNASGRFTFTAGTITVTGGAEGTPEAPSGGQTEGGGAVERPETEVPQFTDVSGHWAEEYIEDAAGRGLIEGFPDSTYRPDDTMTRAQCVTILWRACGEPEPSGKASFTDLDPIQSWYWDAVAWAEENGVVNGVGDGKFDPNGTVTREQLATILFRMSGGSSGMEAMLSGVYDGMYTDSGKISDWARKGLYWSIYNVIYCGVDSVSVGTQLSPGEAADRAQIAVMIVRYLDRE